MGLGALVLITACDVAPGPALPLRSDMSTNGMNQVVTYNLTGPGSNPNEQQNQAELRGVAAHGVTGPAVNPARSGAGPQLSAKKHRQWRRGA